MTLSIVIITRNEEANLPRTLRSVEPLVRDGAGELIVVDSGSTDRTVDIARQFGAKVFVEEWKGFAAQKNSAIDKASGDWVLLLDADEEVSPELATEILVAIGRLPETALWVGAEKPGPIRTPRTGYHRVMIFKLLADDWKRYNLDGTPRNFKAFRLPRKNMFLGRWMRYGGFFPDRKLRLFRRGAGRVEERPVHETVKVEGATATLRGALIHHAYPTLDVYLEHMRRYAELGGQMQAHRPRWLLHIRKWLNPPATWLYNYILRLGFLDGREGALLHWHHARYVRWKYERALAHHGDTETRRKPS
jgi:glycosyltransferase involved in cell wall biosynthesis